MATITRIFPIAGVAGDRVTIQGTELAPGMTVTFAGVPADTTVIASDAAQAIVPTLPVAGPMDVGMADAMLPLAFYGLAAPPQPAADALLQGGVRAVVIDGRAVGWTDGPVRLFHEQVFHEAEIDAEMNPVYLFKRGECWRLEVTLAEISLAHLCVAFEGVSVDEGGEMRLLALGGTPLAREHSLLVQGPGPRGTCRDFYAYRAVVEAREPLVIAREAPQRLTLTFRLLPQMTLPAGQRILRVGEEA